MKIKTNIVFNHLKNSNKRIIIEQGGTRCFLGDTLICCKSAHKKIKDISIGDKVLSLDQSNNKLVFNKVTDKFIYEDEHTLISIKLKDGNTITSTYNHKYLYNGEWIRADELIRRKLDLCKRFKSKIYDKRFGKYQINELQKFQKRENIETSRNPRLFENNVTNRWKIQNSKNSQIGSRAFYTHFKDKKICKSYQWKQIRQFFKKFRMGNTKREYNPLLQIRTSKTTKWRKEWDVKTHSKKSKRNKAKIQTQSLYGKNISKRVWSKFINNKRYSSQKKDMEACSIRLDDIVDFDIFTKKTKVYDIEVENTKNYCVTENNIIVHNSGKTYNILMFIIFYYCQIHTKKKITIVRKYYPSLKFTVMADFFEILEEYGLYDIKNHNRSSNIYKLNGNTIEFFGMDKASKKKGSKRNLLYINEANELFYEDFNQLILRTTESAILDFNPNDLYHWIYDKVEVREDAIKYITTFRDNPFLEDEVIKEILQLKKTDPDLWKIYGMGQIATPKSLIFPKITLVDEEIEGEVFYGLDFGFNHPSALIKCIYGDGQIYWEEIVHQSYLNSNDIIRKLEENEIPFNETIICDSARPEMIRDLRNAGYKAIPTRKGKDSVLDGINFIKKHQLLVNKKSSNLIKELKTYKWKEDQNQEPTEEVVKFNDDACFIAGTKVFTEYGYKNIEDLKIGEKVLTRKGFKPITNTFEHTSNNLYNLTLNNNKTIIGTGNHPIHINNRFIPLCNLQKNYKCTSVYTLLWEKLSSMEKHIQKIKLQVIGTCLNGQIKGNYYTGKYGSITTEKYQKDITYITKTITKITTLLKIWNLLKKANICQNMQKNIIKKINLKLRNISKKLDHLQKSGTPQKKDINGTNNMYQSHYGNQIKKNLTTFVNNVKILIGVITPKNPHGFVQTNANQNIGVNQELTKLQNNVNIVKRIMSQINIQELDFVHAVAVKKIDGQPTKVYNIEVADCPEYYVENILVHNCDAGRYSLEIIRLRGAKRNNVVSGIDLTR